MLGDRRFLGAAFCQTRGVILLSLAIQLLLFSLLSGSMTASSREQVAAQFLDRSETIFVGSLIDARSSLSPDGRLIVTRYVFAVLETFQDQEGLADRSGSTIEIVEYGGTVGDTTLTLSHGVGYQTGSSYLIFAERGESGWLRTIGGPLGRLTVTTERSGQKVVRLYPGHPLSSLMPGPPRLFRRLEEIRARLRDVSGGATR